MSPAGAPRCSAWTRAEGVDPIGSAGCYDGYLLVETPLPWPRDVGQLPELAGLAARAGYRLQALVPSDLAAPPEARRVIVHRRDAGAGFAGYVRAEVARGPSLADAIETALGTAGGAGSEVTGRDGGGEVVDVLVCTHGRRDVCCGSAGTDLALQLAARDPRPGVRFRRTSHTGGHRFAPTFIVLPQGSAWAFASVELVDQVLDRSVPFAEVAGHYRGCAGLERPEVQALERAVLANVGWELLDRRRSGGLTGETAAAGALAYLEAGPDRWEAVVGPGRTMAVPECMKPLAEAKKSETEWVVSGLRPA